MGWQTQLKPGHEPIVFARAPAAHRSIVRNVLEHGTGALNIDACRIALRDGDECHDFNRGYDGHPYRPHELGRFPADAVGSICPSIRTGPSIGWPGSQWPPPASTAARTSARPACSS